MPGLDYRGQDGFALANEGQPGAIQSGGLCRRAETPFDLELQAANF